MKSLPRPGHNGGFVSEVEHEQLTHAGSPDGVLGSPDDVGPVYAEPTLVRTVRVRAGIQAYVRGSLFDSESTDVTLAQLDANASGQPRIDLVVLRLSRADYTITPQVVSGNAAANPTAPAPLAQIGTTGFFDLPLAEVLVASGTTNLSASTVTTRCWYVGPDGQIRCTENTRPPHEQGRWAWEHPSRSLIVSTGSAWIRGVEDSGGAACTMAGGTAPWVASHNTLWRRNGAVFMQLTARRATALMFAGSTYHVATVPPGFRPPYLVQSTATVPSQQMVATIAVHTDGRVLVSPSSDIPINISFVLSTLAWPVGS